MSTSYRYDAFISYSQRDMKDVDCLYEMLTKYPVLFRRRRKIFMDREELVAGDLTTTIRVALASSRYLVVCNSVNASEAPRWINKEIEEFSRSHDGHESILPCQVGPRSDGLTPMVGAMEDICRAHDLELFMPDVRGWSDAVKARNKPALERCRREALALLARILGARDHEAVARSHLKRAILSYAALAVTTVVIVGLAVTGWTAHRKRQLAEAADRAAVSERATDAQDPVAGMRIALSALPADLTRRFGKPLSHAAIRALYHAVHNHRQRRLPAYVQRCAHQGISPDGRFVVEYCDDVTYFSRVTDGELQFKLAGEFPEFDGGGAHVATTLRTGTVRVFETSTGRQITEFTGARPRFVADTYLALEIDGRSVEVRDVRTGGHVTTLKGTNPLPSPAGTFIVTRVDEGHGALWEVASGRSRLRFEADFNLLDENVQFSSDERYFTSPVSPGAAHLWSIPERRMVARITGTDVKLAARRNVGVFTRAGKTTVFAPSPFGIAELGPVDGIDGVLTGDGRMLATTAEDYEHVYLRFTDRLGDFKVLEGHSPVFIWNDQFLHTTTRSGNSFMWRADSAERVLEMKGNIPVSGRNREFLYSGAPAVMRSLEPPFRKTVVDGHFAHFRPDDKLVHDGSVIEGVSPEFCRDMSCVLTIVSEGGFYDGRLDVWSRQTRTTTAKWGGLQEVRRAYYSPSATYLVTEFSSGPSKLWTSSSPIDPVVIDGRDLAFSRADEVIACETRDAEWQLLRRRADTRTYAPVAQRMPGRGPALGRGAKFVAAAVEDDKVQVWHVEGDDVRTLGAPLDGTKYAFSASEELLAVEIGKNTAVDENKVFIHRVGDTRKPVEIAIGRATTNDIQFGCDDKYVVLALSSGVAKVAEVSSGAEVALLGGHDGVLESATFSDDGQSIRTSSYTDIDSMDFGAGARRTWLVYGWRFFCDAQELVETAGKLLDSSGE